MRAGAFLFLTLIGLTVVWPSAAARAEEKPTVAATKEAQAWLALVDGARYGESWDAAAKLFRVAVPRDRWAEQCGAVRGPLGAVVSRKVKSTRFATRLPGAPDGKYVVIQFATSFANKKEAIETVTPMQEGDGSWKVSGYFVK